MSAVTTMTRDEILAFAQELAAGQLGGTLATAHSEDGTPYVTFVLFHLRRDGRVLFGSAEAPQHTRNLTATPESSFLIDNREAVKADWASFHRIVIEGSAAEVAKDAPSYAAYLEELRAKNAMAAAFTERGKLFCLEPRRMIVMKGLEPVRHVVDFPQGG